MLSLVSAGTPREGAKCGLHVGASGAGAPAGVVVMGILLSFTRKYKWDVFSKCSYEVRRIKTGTLCL